MINVWIDEITHCLRDSVTGELVETEVVQISRKSFLSKYNKKNGWGTKWSDLLSENEIYALVIKGTVDIQGLVALKKSDDLGAVYIAWMCTAPQNNKLRTTSPKYFGVGGHLFSIAIDRSLAYGYGGAVTGFAANEKLLQHYCNTFHAFALRALHVYQFVIEEKDAARIREAYNYEWTDAKL